ncbi:gamma-glutamylcyclotransferase [bacterium]|nr:gamma-glutamylcyclotransferase [bacterium]
MSTRHFIIGYGSLINPHSRAVTAGSGVAVPVEVRGFERGWTIAVRGMCVLGAEPAAGASLNAVAVEVDDQQLAAFDRREGEGALYRRVAVPAEDVAVGEELRGNGAKFWLYTVIARDVRPTAHAPIVQSYVDTVLAGCLRYGEEYARRFVESTRHWEHAWVDDRAEPRYARRGKAALEAEELAAIDEVLAGVRGHRVVG